MKRFTVKRCVVSESRRGAMMILMVLCIPVILAFSAFAINVAWMQLTRTELRTATDSAARAASRTLSLTQSVGQARTKAKQAARRNKVAGDGLSLRNSDVTFGWSEEDDITGKWTFEGLPDNSEALNGVRINGSRASGSADGAINMLFTGIFDRTTFEPIKNATASQLDRDVILVLDRSGSMDRTTPTGSRWTDLKSAVQAFLNALDSTPQDELVGVVTYSSSATIDEDMQLTYSNLMATIDGITPGGMTAIGYGIDDGIDAILDPSFARRNAAKTIVVMTDGHHNTGTAPETIAATAQNTHNITVHTVTFSGGANQTHMQTVAADGGGSHWHADDQAQLIAAFEDIANNLPTLITE